MKVRASDMPASLEITARLQVTPLLNIQRPLFARLYRDGVYWSLFKEQHSYPLSDSYLLKSIREALTEQGPDEQQGNKVSLLVFTCAGCTGRFCLHRQVCPDRICLLLSILSMSRPNVAMTSGGNGTLLSPCLSKTNAFLLIRA